MKKGQGGLITGMEVKLLFHRSQKEALLTLVQELSKGNPGTVLVCGEDEKDLKQKMTESPRYMNLTAVISYC
jgi:hypothetical protein